MRIGRGRMGEGSGRAPGRPGPVTAMILAAILALWAGSAAARDLAVTGTAMNGYGRILLEFDRPTEVQARSTGGVLVLTFAEPVAFKSERLAAELPAWISLSRRDPDGSGLRLALQRPVRASVLTAAEKVFVDLLPETWVGLAPGLPADVVAELARRAEAAESRAEARRRAEERRPLTVRMAELPHLTRLVFTPPAPLTPTFAARGGGAELVFPGPLTLDAADLRGRLGGAVTAVTGERAGEGLLVRVALGPGHEAKGMADEGAFVVDVTRIAEPEPPRPPPPKAAPPKPEPAKPEPARPAPGRADAPRPEPAAARAASAPEAARVGGPQMSPAPEAAAPRAPVRPVAEARPDGVVVTFPFRARTAAAAFQRGDALTLVFHGPEPVEPPSGPAPRLLDLRREGAFTVLRLEAGPGRARLAARDLDWVLTSGDAALSEPVVPARGHDEAGRPLLLLPLPHASGVLWTEDRGTGERLAVATAAGPARAIVKAQRFAEVSLVPTLHGAVVAAEADDVAVRSGVDGVAISRPGGLALSPAAPAARPAGASLPEPVLARERWTRDQLGSALSVGRERLDAVVEAARSGRTAARLDLARFLMANGLDHEAAGVLAAASGDDPTLAKQRVFAILSAANAARLHRLGEARRLLGADHLRDDPEAVLWRAVADALARRWAPAHDGFRRAAASLDLYADDLQGLIRPLAIRAALGAGDLAAAESELALAQGLRLGGAYRDEAELLRAAHDEASGREEVALDVFRRLAESKARPLAAEATLRWVQLALRRGAMEPGDAIARLETVAVAWRGGDVEARALGSLGRLYAESGRWRDAFNTARTANQRFADHEVTRALHDETAQLFEDLFLTGKGASLSKMEALALFFDFKEFTPIGRRGDEIVRHLTDRLIALDLLEQAGDLLQHQVENRLTGIPRAQVAARLALIRLTDGKPQAALQALRSTRLGDVPAELRRARGLIEARALSDLTRTDLALEVLEREAGEDVERLRADIVWSGRRWREAGEVHERLAGDAWRGAAPLPPGVIGDVIRAAIAYGLAEERLSLDRLRAKFAAKMADSPEARTFAFLAQPGAAATPAFRDLARKITTADTFAGFLAEYRRRYPAGAIADRPARGEGAPAPTRS